MTSECKNKVKVVLVTTGQPSGNPRIVKEADALHEAGYDVTLIYCFFIKWSLEKDLDLLRNISWKYKLIGGSPKKNKLRFYFTKIRYKISRKIERSTHLFLMAERAQARAFDEMVHCARNIKADWYIGHNLGALAVVVKAAEYNSAKAGFDFEDYYRGEFSSNEVQDLKRIQYLENRYIKDLSYFSSSAPLITEALMLDHPNFRGKIITLLNCFPLSQQPAFKNRVSSSVLNLVWFSQTVGLHRGLEVVIDALAALNSQDIHLTLAGRCNPDILEYINLRGKNIIENIHFAGIISPGDLPEFCSKFDIGLAVELEQPVNRDICLTNKIFTYLLSGNAVIFSNTKAQVHFNDTFHAGISFKPSDGNELKEKIQYYFDIKALNSQRKANYDLARQILNWNMESRKLLELLKII